MSDKKKDRHCRLENIIMCTIKIEMCLQLHKAEDSRLSNRTSIINTLHFQGTKGLARKMQANTTNVLRETPNFTIITRANSDVLI